MRVRSVGRDDVFGIGATIALATAAIVALRVPHGFAPDTDRVDHDRAVWQMPALPPSPALLSRAAECDGGDGTQGTPARPASSPGNWVVTDDYPISALRAEQQGRTGFVLSIDMRGAVARCAITASSGVRSLDIAACAALSRRARFEPARDGQGCPIPSSYRSTVVWQIPDLVAHPPN